MTAVERPERLLAGDPGRMVGARVREASRLAVLVRPGRRAVERRAHEPTLSSVLVARTAPERWLGSSRCRPGTRRPRQSSRGCASSARRRSTQGRRRRSPGSTSAGSSSPASGSTCCSTPARSSSSTASSVIARPSSACARTGPWGDAVVTGYGTVFGRPVCVFSQDFTVFGGSLVGGLRGEGLQGDGHGRQGRVPRRRDQRLGRRADPGGRRLARRLRGDLLAQRAGVGGRPADLADHGAVRGRRRLLARDHGLRADDRGHVLHVHHRARRREDRHRRGGELRGARRRERARNEVGCRAPRRAGRAGVRRRRALPAHVPSPEQPRDGALRAADRPGRSRVTRARRA